MTEEDAWPIDGLEKVEVCPWCQSKSGHIIYNNLKDIIFKTAPGEWKFWICDSCNSGFLSPRPTEQTLYLAYRNYYTHKRTAIKSSSTVNKLINKLRLSLINGYRNRVYNTKFYPSFWAGYYVTRLRIKTTNIIKDDLRYLPPIPEHTIPKVLDIGCGNIGFLRLLSSGGWQAFGCDPDPAVMELLEESDNIDLRIGDSKVFSEEFGNFDAITISHVIEHVHNPITEIKLIYKLLKPGGSLYIDTPNIDSYGHKFWSCYWFGLDAPRHLNLPTKKILESTLEKIGFQDIKFIERPGISKIIWSESSRLEREDTYGSKTSTFRHHKNYPNEYVEPEFLTLTCIKPR